MNVPIFNGRGGLKIPGFTRRRASGASFNAETTALLARMTVQPSTARAQTIDTLIGSLKSAGVWAKIDALYVLASHDAQAARLNWKSSSFTATAVNSPTFTTDRGYQGDGSTSYFDSNFAPATVLGNYAQDSNHAGVWTRTEGALGSIDFGNNAGSLGPRQSGDVMATRSSSTTQVNISGATTALGHSAYSRTGSTGYTGYHNGASIGTATQASAAVLGTGTNTFMLLCRNNGSGVPAALSVRQNAAFHWGAGLSDTEISALYNALSTYMTAVGA